MCYKCYYNKDNKIDNKEEDEEDIFNEYSHNITKTKKQIDKCAQQ